MTWTAFKNTRLGLVAQACQLSCYWGWGSGTESDRPSWTIYNVRSRPDGQLIEIMSWNKKQKENLRYISDGYMKATSCYIVIYFDHNFSSSTPFTLNVIIKLSINLLFWYVGAQLCFLCIECVFLTIQFYLHCCIIFLFYFYLMVSPQFARYILNSQQYTLKQYIPLHMKFENLSSQC